MDIEVLILIILLDLIVFKGFFTRVGVVIISISFIMTLIFMILQEYHIIH